jgi:hypothetical protein
MSILKIRLEHLRNEAHYQFLLLVEKLFAAHPEASAIVAPQLMELNPLVVLEGQLVDAVKASEYTAEIAEADRRVDRDIAGINAAVESALHHFDPVMAEAARRLEIRLKSFRGEIEKKPYEEESAAVKILLADLNGAYATQVSTLNLDAWVMELAAAQEDFERLFLLRNIEWAEKPQEKLRNLQRQINTLYRSIVERIDASVVLNGEQPLGAFVSELNREVEYFNEHSHHHARKDIDRAVVASIPNQTWAEKPVIVLPSVTYEDKELVFTRDYELSYRDNDRPGTATVTIHGKGAYKGTKTATFNIVISE